jgi:hypothetical protein
MALTFDLHVHTDFSYDGCDGIDAIIERAKRVGLDGVAITDHNTVEGALFALEYVKENDIDLIVIPGVEISTSMGHLIALGVKDDIPAGMSPEKTIEITRDIGGVIIAPHPFHPFRHSIGNPGKLDIDAIETFNSRYLTGSSNRKASRYARKSEIPAVAGSDAHVAEAVGLGRTEIESSDSMRSILEGIRNGHTRVVGLITPPRLYLYHEYRRSHRLKDEGYIWYHRGSN